MKPAEGSTHVNRIVWIVLALLVFLVRYFFNSPGSKVEFKNGCTIYYKSHVTEAQAKALGDFLEKTGYFGQERADVQLIKKDGKIQIRFVVQEGVADNEGATAVLNIVAAQARARALDNQPTEAVLVDEKLKDLKVLPPLDLGKGLALGKGTLFYTDAAGEASAKKLLAWATSKKLDEEIWQLDKKGDAFMLKMVFGKPEMATKPQTQTAYETAAAEISEALGAPTEIELVSMALKSLKTIPAPALEKKGAEQPEGAPAGSNDESKQTAPAKDDDAAPQADGDGADSKSDSASPAAAGEQSEDTK